MGLDALEAERYYWCLEQENKKLELEAYLAFYQEYINCINNNTRIYI